MGEPMLLHFFFKRHGTFVRWQSGRSSSGSAHLRHRQALDGGFLVFNGLKFDALGNGTIILEGVLECVGDLAIDVLKTIHILSGSGPTARVQTETYSYNASLRGIGNVFRYDSPHPHYPKHHVHRYDALTRDTRGYVEDIEDEENRPTLGDVLDELRDWYYDNHDKIETGRRET
jgi:hypothetical protein